MAMEVGYLKISLETLLNVWVPGFLPWKVYLVELELSQVQVSQVILKQVAYKETWEKD